MIPHPESVSCLARTRLAVLELSGSRLDQHEAARRAQPAMLSAQHGSRTHKNLTDCQKGGDRLACQLRKSSLG